MGEGDGLTGSEASEPARTDLPVMHGSLYSDQNPEDSSSVVPGTERSSLATEQVEDQSSQHGDGRSSCSVDETRFAGYSEVQARFAALPSHSAHRRQSFCIPSLRPTEYRNTNT